MDLDHIERGIRARADGQELIHPRGRQRPKNLGGGDHEAAVAARRLGCFEAGNHRADPSGVHKRNRLHVHDHQLITLSE